MRGLQVTFAGHSSPEPGESVAPGLLAKGQVQALECLLGGLMGREAGPLMAVGLHGGGSLFKVAQGLIQPVSGAFGHQTTLT